MKRQTVFRGVLVVLFLSVSAEAALANAGAAMLWPLLVPAVALSGFNVAAGLVATVTAAVVEAPFVRRAGMSRHALAHSIGANLLSWLAGYLGMLLLAATDVPGLNAIAYFMFIAYFILAVPMSILIEGAYYHAVLNRDGRAVRWWCVIGANVYSTLFLCAGLVVLIIPLDNYLSLNWTFEPFVREFHLILGTLCLLLVAFALRALGQWHAALREPAQRGPESQGGATEPALRDAAIASARGNDAAEVTSIRDEACQHVD